MAVSSYQSLYRRFRPQRFSEVRGQDHVTRALRNAVRDGRIGHAYLFSGPRGTGKTSTARILAKVLNCAAPEDGEPCGKCDNCLAVEQGLVTDWLLEQDAASKSKVDDMRELLDRVPLGTSGNRKVIILDEVHMLSQGAENALLKTLEEPPDHVVFVLATTDPQKVRATIRSRTQHFDFHLLPPDVMEEHVRQVIDQAELALDDTDHAVAHVVRVGGGSARDTLSALDQVAALGEVMADIQPVDAILDALVGRDAGAVLVAVADALATGREPRALGEAVIGRLRDAFLAVMGAADEHLAAAERTRAQELGEALGAAGLTRALEVLGEALTELSRKPDPRIVLEVALVRLVRPEADQTLDGVLARLDRIEKALAGGTPPPAASPAPKAVSGAAVETPTAKSPDPESAPETSPASAARAVLAANRPAAKPKGERRPSAPASAPTGPPAEEASAVSAAAAAPAERPGPSSPEPPAPPPPEPPPADAIPTAEPPAAAKVPDLAGLTRAWTGEVLPQLPISVRSKWRGGSWAGMSAEGAARFAVDNQWHQQACESGRAEVERALTAHLGTPVRVEVVVGAGAANPVDAPPAAADDGSGGEEIGDIRDLPDANDVATGGVDLLLREFGGELVEEDPR